MYPSSEVVIPAVTFVIGLSSLVVTIISQDRCARRNSSALVSGSCFRCQLGVARQAGKRPDMRTRTVLKRIKALERSISQFEDRQACLIRTLETNDDPDGTVFRQIRERMQEGLKRNGLAKEGCVRPCVRN